MVLGTGMSSVSRTRCTRPVRASCSHAMSCDVAPVLMARIAICRPPIQLPAIKQRHTPCARHRTSRPETLIVWTDSATLYRRTFTYLTKPSSIDPLSLLATLPPAESHLADDGNPLTQHGILCQPRARGKALPLPGPFLAIYAGYGPSKNVHRRLRQE